MSVEIDRQGPASTRMSPDEKAQTDRRIDLDLRYLLAGLENTALLEEIPNGVHFFLLPDDDPDFVEREIAFAATVARRGDNVYLRHVRVADLPEPPPPTVRPAVGDRRIDYAEDGSISSNFVYGEDGEWHETDEPPPAPLDDDPW